MWLPGEEHCRQRACMVYSMNNRKDTVPGVERARERVEADEIRVLMYSQITQGLVNLVMHRSHLTKLGFQEKYALGISTLQEGDVISSFPN